MTTKVQSCTCKNAGQDKLHGEGRRVFNKTTKATVSRGSKTELYRCTVCGKEK